MFAGVYCIENVMKRRREHFKTPHPSSLLPTANESDWKRYEKAARAL